MQVREKVPVEIGISAQHELTRLGYYFSTSIAEAAASAQRRQVILSKEKQGLVDELTVMKADLAHSQVSRAKAEVRGENDSEKTRAH